MVSQRTFLLLQHHLQHAHVSTPHDCVWHTVTPATWRVTACSLIVLLCESEMGVSGQVVSETQSLKKKVFSQLSESSLQIVRCIVKFWGKISSDPELFYHGIVLLWNLKKIPVAQYYFLVLKPSSRSFARVSSVV